MTKHYCPNCGMSLAGGDMGGAAGAAKGAKADVLTPGDTGDAQTGIGSSQMPSGLKHGKGASKGAAIVIALLKKHKSKHK